MDKLRVTHVISALTTGGAESMLRQVVATLDGERFETEVVALSGGPVKEQIEALGVRVTVLGMPRGVPDPRGIGRLARHFRSSRPHVVQSWLYHADLVAGLAARMAGRRPVLWGIHNTTLNPADTKRTTVWTRALCARLSHYLPRRIVCCSVAARDAHAALGYAAERMVVIPNGFDLSRFGPNPASRAELRAELGVADDTPLVGLVARFDAQKDHANFIAAAGRLHTARPDVRFVLCGRDVTWDNSSIASWLDEAGIREVSHVLGPRDDIPWLMAGLDVACSSSVGEAFPMAVGEAMACGIPCAATDVGDTALLVADTGRIVPPRDSAALADALGALLALGPAARAELGEAARRRVADNFELGKIVSRYQELWLEVAREANSRGSAARPTAG